MIINVQIERVVLDGVPVASHQVPLLRRHLAAELRRLLAGAPGGPVPPPGGAVPVLRTPMPARGTADAAGWGKGIAGAIHQVMPR
jgi:hypothetical protein